MCSSAVLALSAARRLLLLLESSLIVELAVLFLAHTEDNFLPRLTLFLLFFFFSAATVAAANTVNGEETEGRGDERRTDGRTLDQ